MDKRLETVRLGLRKMQHRVDGMDTSLTVARAELRGLDGRIAGTSEESRRRVQAVFGAGTPEEVPVQGGFGASGELERERWVCVEEIHRRQLGQQTEVCGIREQRVERVERAVRWVASQTCPNV